LVEDGVTGRTVPPADPAALAEALAELLRQPQTAQRMGEAGRAAARQRFRPEVIAGQYLALYREVARL
jgi:glycosyltransferase involved in cell wall biosynthesis